jgi:hypothetical protein
MALTLDEITQTLVWAGKVLVAEGQDDFTRGHISFRLPGNPAQFLMKPHSIGLDELTIENILSIDLDGRVTPTRRRRTDCRDGNGLRNAAFDAIPAKQNGGRLGLMPSQNVLFTQPKMQSP